ncbi:FMN-binding protein [Streptomyces sp. AC495_CC817]|uniref:FMN-binding protein n=1 Tax=Streptomyces sp. AC495_CC817 TaxID=2823900 RepID=UPI001C274567|nr:FMN-binding protein [Streptomyces sp. AC495_CC817]
MKKSHPIRRTLLATAATVSGIVLLLSLKPASDPAGSVQAGAAGGAPSAQGGVAAGAQTLTGTAVQTDYGPVQVRISVNGGKITGAEAVQQPSGGRSTQISADAIPKLNQAAVAAGSAEIDAVSGATYTSAGYKESLQSALDQAGNAQDSGSEVEAGGSQDAGGGAEDGEGSGAGQATGTQVLTGSTIQTDYGPVQVRVTVTDGKITNAEALQQPSGGRSTQISSTAIPELNQNAVSAGSADIDAVSGATYTSGGYKQSLQSALDQAG